MLAADFLGEDAGEEWARTPALAAGRGPRDGTPDARVGVTRDGAPFLRIDLHIDREHVCFQAVRCLGSRVAIGFGGHLHWIDLATRTARSLEMDGYFGGLYTPGDFGLPGSPFALLAASATSLLRFTVEGELVWEAGDLGIDGVIVHDVDASRITGTGEWDPPGGWKDFELELDTGARIA